MVALKIEVLIERKQEDLPAFVVVPASRVARWKLTATTTVEGTLAGVALGRRSLKRWDDARWFIELRREVLEACGKAPGDRALLVISPATTALPAELARLIETDAHARARWDALTEAQRRMLREDILGAKTAATRADRSRRALLPVASPPAPRIVGLPSAPRTIAVHIIGRRLPGRTCGPYTEISVALAQKTGCDPDAFVSAAAREARWETTIEVREQGGAPAFRGPAVNGPPTERFLYLTWLGRKGGAAPAMFRRAKLRLDAIPATVLTQALRSGVLLGRLELTARDGMPLCASVRPPVIAWSSG